MVVEHDGVAPGRHGGAAAAVGAGLALGLDDHAVHPALRGADGVDDDDVGEQFQHLILDRRAEHDGAGGHDEQRGQVPAAGVFGQGFDQRAGHGVAGDHDRRHPVGLDGVKHRLCAEVADEHHGVALEEKPQRAPLGGAVHQRRGVQRHHWRVGCSGLVGQFLSVGDPFVGVGVHPAAERIEHVLVAPHHPLGHAGGAAGVEHVEVVARAFQLWTFGTGVGDRLRPRHRTHSGRVGVAAVLDHHEVPQAGHASGYRLDAVEVGPVVDEGDQVGVVEQVGQLVFDVAEVDVDRHTAHFERRHHGDQPLDGVLGVDADVVAGADALGEQVIGHFVGLGVELGEGQRGVAAHHRRPVGHRVDGAFEQVGDVEPHRAVLAPNQNTVSFFGRGRSRHPGPNRLPCFGRSGRETLPSGLDDRPTLAVRRFRV